MLQPFNFLNSPFLPYQPTFNQFFPSPSLSTFPKHSPSTSLPSFSLPYLPCPFCSSLILIFVFPCQPSHSLLFLFPSFPVPSLTVHFLTYLSPLPILPICYYSPPFSVCLHFSFPCFFLSPPLGSLIPPPPGGLKEFFTPLYCFSDQYPGHPDSINSLLSVTDNVVLTGCEDGSIRAVHLFPHRFIGNVSFVSFF